MASLRDVLEWAQANSESGDTIRALRRVPVRLGMLDADLAQLPADLVHFERVVASNGYSLAFRATDASAAGRREDSRIRAVLRRFLSDTGGTSQHDQQVRAHYDALMGIVASHSGRPGSGKRWNIGRERTLSILRARARLAPDELTQAEINRIGLEVTAQTRKSLRKAVTFLTSLQPLSVEIPELCGLLPLIELSPPAGSARARRVNWDSLPASFRASFDDIAAACLSGSDDLTETLLARIDAGEDPETVMAEADELGRMQRGDLRKPDLAKRSYRQAITWLVRSWEDAGGNPHDLHALQDVLERQVIERAIADQVRRSIEGRDLRDPLESSTLLARLTPLTTLATRGLRDPRLSATIKLLTLANVHTPRKRLRAARNGEAIPQEVDRIVSQLRQRPELASAFANAPKHIAELARTKIMAAQAAKQPMAEITALRLFAGSVAYAVQLSRPLRTSSLRHARISAQGGVDANLLRSPKAESHLTLRFAPWEIKNGVWVNVDVTGSDAEILREWLDRWRPRLIALQGLNPDCPYLFPGSSQPVSVSGDPLVLPPGCYSPSAFLDLWSDASDILGIRQTPHRMRHVVALLILTAHPGNYALVSSVLGNREDTARRYYGRDDGQAAAQVARQAMLAAHPDLFKSLNRRHRR